MIEQYTNPITKNSVALHIAYDELLGFAFIVAVVDNDNKQYEETKFKATDFRQAIKLYDETKKKFQPIIR